MATLHLTIGGRRHELTCRDGEERHLERLVEMVDAKAKSAGRQMGDMSEARQMLFAALLLADELNDARVAAERVATAPAAPPLDPAIALRVEELAERLEHLAFGAPEDPPPLPAGDATAEQG